MKIPVEAVEATAQQLRILDTENIYGAERSADIARRALESAAPFMRQGSFLEMNLRAVQEELDTPLQFGKANR